VRQFWNLVTKDTNTGTEAVLTLEGEIASEESWWYDTVTPQAFRAELARCKGPLTVWINSPGGDPFAASAIYTALIEYKSKGRVTGKISGIAASAASVIAMAADDLLMSPTAYLMVHNPWTIAMGDSRELAKVAGVLDEIRDGMINAYMAKTGYSKAEIIAFLDDETYMNSTSAMDNKFCDGILYADQAAKDAGAKPPKAMFGRNQFYAMAVKAVQDHPKDPPAAPDDKIPPDTSAARRKEIALRASLLAADIATV